MLFFISILLWISTCDAQDLETTLSIIAESNVTRALEGSNVVVTCLAMNLRNNPISWSHRDRNIAIVPPGGNIVYLDPGQDRAKYNLTNGSSEGGNFTFTIRDLSLNDIGDVSCSVMSGAVSAFHRIDVIKYPDEAKINVVSQQPLIGSLSDALIVGTSLDEWLNLSCVAFNSRPSAQIEWFWNNSNVLSQWNVTTEVTISEENNLFNTSNSLYLSPSFFAIFFGLNATETDRLPFTNTTANSSEENIEDEQRPVGTDVLNLADMKLSFNLTCNVSVDGWQTSRSILVQIGDYPPQKPSSSITICSLSCLLILFSTSFVMLLMKL